MSLEVNKQALLSLFHKKVDAGLFRFCEYRITTRGQGILPHLIPPGMREPQRLWRPTGQLVVTDLRFVKDPKLLVCQRVPADGVALEYRRMRRKAGQNRGSGVLFGPCENIDHR